MHGGHVTEICEGALALNWDIDFVCPLFQFEPFKKSLSTNVFNCESIYFFPSAHTYTHLPLSDRQHPPDPL